MPEEDGSTKFDWQVRIPQVIKENEKQLRADGKENFDDVPKQGSGRRLSETYTIQDLPPNVRLEDIELQLRANANIDHSLLAIFKCKDDCKTLFAEDHVKEM